MTHFLENIIVETNRALRRKKKIEKLRERDQETETGENKDNPVQPTHVNPQPKK